MHAPVKIAAENNWEGYRRMTRMLLLLAAIATLVLTYEQVIAPSGEVTIVMNQPA